MATNELDWEESSSSGIDWEESSSSSEDSSTSDDESLITYYPDYTSTMDGNLLSHDVPQAPATYDDSIPVDSSDDTPTKLRLATWNKNHDSTTPSFIETVLQGHIHLLMVQEPMPCNLSKKRGANQVSWLQRECHQHNLQADMARLGGCIFDKKALGPTTAHTALELDGRICTQVFQLPEQQYLVVIGVYQVVDPTGPRKQ